jgi:hypothetical protein
MKQYNSLYELILDLRNYPIQGGIYFEKSKFDDLKKSKYWVTASKEEKEEGWLDDGSFIPVILKDFNVKKLLDIQTFQGIIDLKMENNPNIKLEETDIFLEAILYYLENDDFLD